MSKFSSITQPTNVPENLVQEEIEQLQKKAALAARRWEYTTKLIDDSQVWSILYKEAINPVAGAKDNEQWSVPFRIINGVLFHCDFCYKGKSWAKANKLIPQGLFDRDPNEITNW